MTTFSDDEKALRAVFGHINELRGLDLSLYRHATVQRKLDLRLDETGCRGYSAYLAYLKAHPGELDELISALTIKVSNFFRNPLVFEILSALVLPELLSTFGFLRVWSLGCAKGEEPYSVAILLQELIKRERKAADAKILGTDICEGAFETALKGIYPEKELAEVKKGLLDTYFRQVLPSPEAGRHESQYVIGDEVKYLVKFECGEIIRSLRLKSEKQNLILCRNVLIYMNRSLQEEALRYISDLLHEKGVLVIGESETLIGPLRDVFTQIVPGVKIYRKGRG